LDFFLPGAVPDWKTPSITGVNSLVKIP
jgi:hypothetical protein